ncbi:NAD(P)H-dependent oxidoreductase [Streptomyces wuyuanensis]|uniref:NAD(P)H-dependent oxidoreductase n=1 Tax=Streptomyces wuyuanensis TaxID=1196353 RepID=UPI003808782A
MAHLLHIDSSAAPAGSVSREVATTFRITWEEEHASGTVTHLDLARSPVPHLTPAGISARSKGPGTPREGWDFATPCLRQVLGEGLGLDVHTIQVELTMAHHSPAMADLGDPADTNRANAHSDAEKRARLLAQEIDR